MCFPCQPRPATLRKRLFHDGCGIDEDFDLAVEAGRQELGKVLQLPLDDIMIVAIPGINRNGSIASLR